VFISSPVVLAKLHEMIENCLLEGHEIAIAFNETTFLDQQFANQTLCEQSCSASACRRPVSGCLCPAPWMRVNTQPCVLLIHVLLMRVVEQGDGGAEIRLRERERELEIAREDVSKANTEIQKLKAKNTELQRELTTGETY
jgi:hypothetical protein